MQCDCFSNLLFNDLLGEAALPLLEAFDMEVIAHRGANIHYSHAYWQVILCLLYKLVVDNFSVCLINSEEDIFDKVLLNFYFVNFWFGFSF